MRKIRMTKKDRARFWSRVKIGTGCWEWQAAKSMGYGVIRVNGGNLLAHRVSAKLCGKLQNDSLCVCHKCDNPSCVRPSHLFAGRNIDNVRDMWRKGRAVIPAISGERHYLSKNTDADVRRAIRMRSRGATQWAIAHHFGVKQSTVWRWLQRDTRRSATMNLASEQPAGGGGGGVD